METTVKDEDRQRIYEFCRTQLSGKWTEVSESELIIKSLKDGQTVQIFLCSLPENIETKYNKVVLKFVGEVPTTYRFFDTSGAEAIITILSELNISPKLLCFSTIGTISEFIESRYFNENDEQNEKTVKLLAQKLAKFHSIEIPINKDLAKNSFIHMMDEMFKERIEPKLSDQTVSEAIKSYDSLRALDLAHELQWLKEVIIELKSPIVLSHNDLNRSNILVRESKDSTDVEIFIIDFDWSNYNYRGIDLGQYFLSLVKRDTEFDSTTFPTDQQMTVFIDAYISEMSKIFGDSYTKHAINSRESLIKESKVFALMAYIKNMIALLWNITDNTDKLAKVQIIYQSYCLLKYKLIREYI